MLNARCLIPGRVRKGSVLLPVGKGGGCQVRAPRYPPMSANSPGLVQLTSNNSAMLSCILIAYGFHKGKSNPALKRAAFFNPTSGRVCLTASRLALTGLILLSAVASTSPFPCRLQAENYSRYSHHGGGAPRRQSRSGRLPGDRGHQGPSSVLSEARCSRRASGSAAK